jgi:catechol 2,3-dioxygenase-like lactoylglutathione lyase family enzyme
MSKPSLPILLALSALTGLGPSFGQTAGEDPVAPALTGGLLVQLQVADLERSVRFYRDILGFEITERRDDLQFAHVATGLKGLQLGLSAGGTTPPRPGTTVLNFDVIGDLEILREGLSAKGVQFHGPTAVIPGKVRLATFADPDGYLLRLAGEDTEVGR